MSIGVQILGSLGKSPQAYSNLCSYSQRDKDNSWREGKCPQSNFKTWYKFEEMKHQPPVSEQPTLTLVI